MGIADYRLTYKKSPERLVASIRQAVSGRAEMQELLHELAGAVPPENRRGDFFWINHFINSLESGFDVEVGVPVEQPVTNGKVTTRNMPEMQFLTVLHEGPAETIGESYQKIRAANAEHGFVSEEFMIESFSDPECIIDGPIEVQFVLHDWAGLFRQHLSRVVGEEAAGLIFGEMETITIDTPLQERTRLTCQAVSRLAVAGDEFVTYDVISSCAHVFPDTQTAKLNQVYQDAVAEGGDKLAAIDAVLAFMDADPGWPEGSRREGEVIYSVKNPRDKAGYEAAQTEAERRKAYCFCPLIREHLEGDIPPAFCYCSAGWFRKQWQDASGKPVVIEIVESLTKGDDRCQFAIKILD